MKKALQLFKQALRLPVLQGITEEAEERRNELALAAVAVKTVTNAEEQDAAAKAAVDIQTYVKAVQAAGLDYRRPISAFTAQIKAAEDDHLKPLLAEKDRIGRLVADFQEKEARRVAREEEERRQAFEAAEAKRLEAERLAQEAAERAAESGKGKDAKLAAKLEQQAVAAEEQVQSVIRAPEPARATASGTAVKKVLRWEVTDLKALYAARPELCTVEPKASAIQAVCVPEMPVPGLKLWWENKAVFSKR